MQITFVVATSIVLLTLKFQLDQNTNLNVVLLFLLIFSIFRIGTLLL